MQKYKWLTEDEKFNMSQKNPEFFEDESKFVVSGNVHPEKITHCWINRDDSDKNLQLLKNCPGFNDEVDDGEGATMCCDHCWALGHHSVCERALTQQEQHA
jgi:hypothetical protein